MVLPSAADAAAWYVDAVRQAVHDGERLDPGAISLLVSLAPHDPVVSAAIESVDDEPHQRGLALLAREVSEVLRRDEGELDLPRARAAVTRLEEAMLSAYRPGSGFERLEDNVAVAGAMLDAYLVGADATHLMMAEELMLTVIRRDWSTLAAAAFDTTCEAGVVLWRLADAAEQPNYRTRAREAFAVCADRYRRHGWRAAPFISALRVIS